MHYRRYFSNGKLLKRKEARILSEVEFQRELACCDILLPRPRNYWIETSYSQYAHAHHAIDLDTTREILRERYPAYIKAFDASMQRRVGHRFNMFVMSHEKLHAWCAWLFDVLFEFGFVAERLLDVWIETNGYRYRELPVLNTESQHWLRKGGSFVLRKIGVHVR